MTPSSAFAHVRPSDMRTGCDPSGHSASLDCEHEHDPDHAESRQRPARIGGTCRKCLNELLKACHWIASTRRIRTVPRTSTSSAVLADMGQRPVVTPINIAERKKGRRIRVCCVLSSMPVQGRWARHWFPPGSREAWRPPVRPRRQPLRRASRNRRARRRSRRPPDGSSRRGVA